MYGINVAIAVMKVADVDVWSLSLRNIALLLLLWEFLLCRLIACLFVDEHMMQACKYIDPLFVATNVDRSDCVHMVIGALQR